MSDTPTLARFSTGWAPDGTSKDGLPHYRETVNITLSRPPYLQIDREATEEDFETYEGPYKLFLKEQAGKKKATGTKDGFPLALWPVVSASELMMLTARDIYTVEQLARHAGRDHGSMPNELKELATRAKAMTDMAKEVGKFEEIISSQAAQLAVMKEQADEMRTTIKTQDGIINSLKLKVA